MHLTYYDRGTSGTQIDVVSGDVVICFMYRARLVANPSQSTRWDWTWRMECGPDGWQKNGSAPTKEIAQQRIEQQWRLWFEAAGLAEGEPQRNDAL